MATAAPFAREQAQAHARVVATRRKQLAKVKVYVPDIQMTPAQRRAADQIILKGLRNQGVNLADANDRAALPKAAQQQLAGVVQRRNAAQQRVDQSVARADLAPARRLNKGYKSAGEEVIGPDGLIVGKGSRYSDPWSKPKLDTRQKQVRKAILSTPNPRQSLATYGAAVGKSHQAQAKPGAAPTKVSTMGLSVNLSSLGRTLASATTLDTGDLGPRKLVKSIFADAGQLATSPFVGGYELGAAAVEGIKKHPYLALGGPAGLLAAVGSTKRGQRLGKGVFEGLKQSSPGLLVQGKPNAALKEFGAHPLMESLNFLGAEALAGRSVGAVARGLGSTAEGASGVRGALGRLGDTRLNPIATSLDPNVVEQGAYVTRRGSKDVIRQKLRRSFDSARKPVTREDGSVVTVDVNGKQMPVLKANTGGGVVQGLLGSTELERLQRKQANYDAGRGQAEASGGRSTDSGTFRVRRTPGITRGEDGKLHVAKPNVKGRAEADLTAMGVNGTLTSAKHFVGDLTTHRDRLAGMIEHDRAVKAEGGPSSKLIFATEKDVAAAQARVDLANKILEDPKRLAQAKQAAKRIISTSEERGRLLVARDAEMAKLNYGDAEELKRARLKDTAVEHGIGRFFTVQDHRALEREAFQAENAAAREAVKLPKGSPERAAAEAHVAELRDHRIAVSGRDPEGVRAHEKARAVHRVAKRESERTDLAKGRLTQSRTRAVQARSGAQARLSAARRRGDKPQVARERQNLAKHQARIDKIDNELMPKAEAAAKVAHAERKVALADWKRTPLPETREALRTPSGRNLPTKDIEAFLRSRGRDPETVAYLPGQVSSSQFYMQPRPARPTLKSAVKTGAQQLKGLGEATAEIVRAAGVRSGVILSRIRSMDRAVREHGVRHPAWAKAQRGAELTAQEKKIVEEGGLWKGPEADEFIRQAAERGEHYVAWRAYPAKLDNEVQKIIREKWQGPAGMESIAERIYNDQKVSDATELAKNSERNIVLMPAAYDAQIAAHIKPAGAFGRTFQVLNRAFRYAVLPQMRWLTGNFVEPYIVRLTAEGSGVNVLGLGRDLLATRKVLKSMERSESAATRQAAKTLREWLVGQGLFVGGGETRAITRRIRDIKPGPYANLVQRMPFVNEAADLLGTAIHWVALPLRLFFQANKVIEQGAQRAAFGRSATRDMQEFTGSWIKAMTLQKAAIEELGKGLTNTPTQLRFMREQEVMLGKYGNFNPTMRAFVQGPTPFIPWMLNAARFVYWTLPAHHSILTSLLNQVNQVTAQDWADQHRDLPPGSLKYAVPNGKGGWIDLARYTPWGAFTEQAGGGSFDSIVGQFLPQISGVQAALRGQDAFGRDLAAPQTAENPEGKVTGFWGLMGVAANQAAGSLLPGYSTAQRIREGGGTAYSTSSPFSPKTKPGSKHGGAGDKILNPFRPTYLRGAFSSGSGGPTVPANPAIRRRLAAARATRTGGPSAASLARRLKAARASTVR